MGFTVKCLYKKDIVGPQVIHYKITITMLDQKIQVAVEVTGTEYVLVSLEMNFRKVNSQGSFRIEIGQFYF